MSGYNDTRNKILNALLARPNGTEIQPEGHQDFALSLLDYIRNVELISASTLIGIATANTVPVQPNTANAAYIAAVPQYQTIIFNNFFDENGEKISVTSSETEAKLVILIWTRQYWSKEEIPIKVDKGDIYYQFKIRKTYESKDAMNADKTSPIGNDGLMITIGEVVSVYNELNPNENGIYSYEIDESGNPYWQFQMKTSVLESRTLDGGRADSVYNNVLDFDGGGA
jgi:hypothetical protein